MHTQNTDVYFRYIDLVNQLKQSQSMLEMDALEQSILRDVLLASQDAEEISTSKVCANKIASPSTMHKCLARLVDRKVLQYQTSADGRRRTVALAPLGVQHVQAIGSCLVAATQ